MVAGDWDRNLYVHDAVNGKVLFQTRLSSAVQGFPITYAVKGKQYLAVPVGTGSPRVVWAARILPEKNAPPPGNALFVFALPERSTSSQSRASHSGFATRTLRSSLVCPARPCRRRGQC